MNMTKYEEISTLQEHKDNGDFILKVWNKQDKTFFTFTSIDDYINATTNSVDWLIDIFPIAKDDEYFDSVKEKMTNMDLYLEYNWTSKVIKDMKENTLKALLSNLT